MLGSISCLKEKEIAIDASPCIVEKYYGLTMHESDLIEYNIDSVNFQNNIYTIKTSSKIDSNKYLIQIYRDDAKPLETGKVMIYRHLEEKEKAMFYDNIKQAAVFKIFKEPDLSQEFGEIKGAGPICVEIKNDTISLSMNFKLYPNSQGYQEFYGKLGLYNTKTTY
jgi:hypothetical protein